MRKILLDTSVIIKWFKSEKEEKLKEALSCLADYTKGKIQICIPAITLFEFINIATFDDSLPPENWKLNIKKFLELNLETLQIDKKIAQEIYEFGRKNKVSAYDASYVVLAKTYTIDFVTADAKLAAKVKLPYVKIL